MSAHTLVLPFLLPKHVRQNHTYVKPEACKRNMKLEGYGMFNFSNGSHSQTYHSKLTPRQENTVNVLMFGNQDEMTPCETSNVQDTKEDKKNLVKDLMFKTLDVLESKYSSLVVHSFYFPPLKTTYSNRTIYGAMKCALHDQTIDIGSIVSFYVADRISYMDDEENVNPFSGLNGMFGEVSSCLSVDCAQPVTIENQRQDLVHEIIGYLETSAEVDIKDPCRGEARMR